jgi:hypothetical protein
MQDWFSLDDLDGGIKKLMLHRAPVNALNPAFWTRYQMFMIMWSRMIPRVF